MSLDRETAKYIDLTVSGCRSPPPWQVVISLWSWIPAVPPAVSCLAKTEQINCIDSLLVHDYSFYFFVFQLFYVENTINKFHWGKQLITYSIQILETAKAFLLPLLLTHIPFSRWQQHLITPVFIPQSELASPATPLSPFNTLYLIHCTDGALSLVNLINVAWRKSIFHHHSPVFHLPLRFAHQSVREAALVAPLQWFWLFNITIKDVDCRDMTRANVSTLNPLIYMCEIQSSRRHLKGEQIFTEQMLQSCKIWRTAEFQPLMPEWCWLMIHVPWPSIPGHPY